MCTKHLFIFLFNYFFLKVKNKDGAFCEGSCPTQAWSITTLIEALDEF